MPPLPDQIQQRPGHPQAGLDTLEYDKRWGFYRLRLTMNDIKTKSEILEQLSKLAYARRAS